MSDQPEDLDAAMRALLDQELVEASSGDAGAPCSEPCAPVPDSAPSSQSQPASDRAAGKDRETPPAFRDAIADIAAQALKLPRDRLDVRENMSRYGVDSIIVTEIMKRVSDVLDVPIAPTVFWGPMAFAIMGGLLVATVLTLIFLPVLYVTVFGKEDTPPRAQEEV